jgi:hypothetical protein
VYCLCVNDFALNETWHFEMFGNVTKARLRYYARPVPGKEKQEIIEDETWMKEKILFQTRTKNE